MVTHYEEVLPARAINILIYIIPVAGYILDSVSHDKTKIVVINEIIVL